MRELEHPFPSDAPESRTAKNDPYLDPVCESQGPALVEGDLFWLVNRYFSAPVVPLCAHPVLFDPAMRDLLQGALEEVGQRDGFNTELSIIFWPSNSPPQRPVSLGILLDQLADFGITEVKIAASQPLNAMEEELCRGLGVEVIALAVPPDRGVDVPPSFLNPNEVETQRKEEGISGADRLREVLHCLPSWAYTKTPIKPQPWSHWITPQNTLDCNRCFLHLCANSVQAEERMARHFLSHVLPSFPLSPQTKSSVASFFPFFLPTGKEFWLSNKYFSATVELSIYGGLCGLQSRQEVPPLDFLASCQAFILICTRASLHLASRTSTSLTMDPHSLAEGEHHRHAQHVGGPSPANLAGTLKNVQGLLANQWTLEQEAFLTNADGPGEVEITTSPSHPNAFGDSAGLKRFAILYIIDADLCDEALLDEIFAEVNQIVLDNRGDLGDTTDAMTVNFSLIEVVGMKAMRPSRHVETFETEGCSRIREALEQHRWLYTHSTTEKLGEPNKVKTPEVSPNAISRILPSQDKMESKMESIPSDAPYDADEKKETPPSIGCEPPQHYLMDPQSLRTEPVPALLYFNTLQTEGVEGNYHALQDDVESTSGSLQDDFTNLKKGKDKDLEMQHYDELMGWVNRIKRYGDHLPPNVRQVQAELLTLALGKALS
ncbi:unnamed protein product [Phytomonas sp. Hart1]|nr:unnamed protein product [Phytomonas sp. Hart1]|eukprot:CCW66017.1 unnamed protein product [Phytomonas sp. isolate Hart1]